MISDGALTRNDHVRRSPAIGNAGHAIALDHRDAYDASFTHYQLFLGDQLIAAVALPDRAPRQLYEVDGVRYRAMTYLQATEMTGMTSYDVQVRPLANDALPAT